MREVLFRGKHIHAVDQNAHLNGKWIEGYLSDKNYINSPELEGEFLIDEETICQYTGVIDKNGRKIFEGDIVKHYYNKDEPSWFDIGVILWNEEYCGFYRSSKKDDSFYRINNHYCVYEIIGNIFDNPELLEVKNETD